MQRYQLRKPTSFLKQDTIALVAVAGYVIFVFFVMKGWGFLSKEANAFVSNVDTLLRQRLLSRYNCKRQQPIKISVRMARIHPAKIVT
jgi:hypothetical protein